MRLLRLYNITLYLKFGSFDQRHLYSLVSLHMISAKVKVWRPLSDLPYPTLTWPFAWASLCCLHRMKFQHIIIFLFTFVKYTCQRKKNSKIIVKLVNNGNGGLNLREKCHWCFDFQLINSFDGEISYEKSPHKKVCPAWVGDTLMLVVFTWVATILCLISDI